ncbi:MAG TPA: hypothetical protein VF070_34610 [Streptosporangiaceae bacterium]
MGPSSAATRVRPLAVRRDLEVLARELTEMTRSHEVSWYDDHHRWASRPFWACCTPTTWLS